MQEGRNSSALAMELRLSRINPWTYETNAYLKFISDFAISGTLCT